MLYTYVHMYMCICILINTCTYVPTYVYLSIHTAQVNVLKFCTRNTYSTMCAGERGWGYIVHALHCVMWFECVHKSSITNALSSTHPICPALTLWSLGTLVQVMLIPDIAREYTDWLQLKWAGRESPLCRWSTTACAPSTLQQWPSGVTVRSDIEEWQWGVWGMTVRSSGWGIRETQSSDTCTCVCMHVHTHTHLYFPWRTL